MPPPSEPPSYWRPSTAVTPAPSSSSPPLSKGRRRAPLHNFSFPGLGWSGQRHLQCSKLAPPNGMIVDDYLSDHHQHEEREGFQELRARLLAHYNVSADGGGKVEGSGEGDDATARPWNLRKRRATACDTPLLDTRLRLKASSSSPAEKGRSRTEATVQEEKRERPPSLHLNFEEIKEDFLLMMGAKPSKKPKRRTLKVQRQVDSVVPGLRLLEMAADLYKIP